MYALIRKLLFCLPPETAHHLSLKALQIFHYFFKLKNKKTHPVISLWGLDFPNRIGLAAGLDKNADYIDALFSLGFGFIEVGTVTPRAQPGNPKPRLFRIPKAKALINRMGFNNKGVDYLVANLKKRKTKGIVGVNIGKNFDTPLEKAGQDYLHCLAKVYPFADYVVVNISSPNTPGLRDLQSPAYFADLLAVLKREQQRLQEYHHRNVPLLIKLSPDLTQSDWENICQQLLMYKIEGVIVTNTTLSRKGVEQFKIAKEQGGLSGQPLFANMLRCVAKTKALTQNKIPIIAVGGIASSNDASKALAAGASLVQIYTGLIYQGMRIYM